MTDLEITKACAEAMGLSHIRTDYESGGFMHDDTNTLKCNICNEYAIAYDPLHDNAQAMALVKKLSLYISGHGGAPGHTRYWQVSEDDLSYGPADLDLNRAICECVAKMQKVK
mgnify:CR=1 FL=1